MGWNQKRRLRRNERLIRVLVIIVSLVVLAAGLTGIESQAKARIKLSRTKKTYHMTGTSDKLTLKNAPKKAKVRWKSSNSKVIRLNSGKKRTVWFKVKNIGKATVTATYKGKKYRCRITVKNMESDGDTNKSDDIAIDDDYDRGDGEKDSTDDTGASDDTSSDDGAEDIAPEPKVDEQAEIDAIFQDFKDRYIREGMTEYERMVAVAEFVTYEHDYELYQYDWKEFLIKGSGDCYASRFAVQYLSRDVGLKAVACPSFDCDGQTIVKADGQMYLITTGYDMPRPGKYMIWKMSDDMFRHKVVQNNIDASYFDD